MKSRVVATVLFTFLCLQSHAFAQSPKASIAEINAYVVEIDAYVKRNPRLKKMFGDAAEYEDNKSDWREFKTRAAFDKATLYESATVWTKTGKVIFASFTFTSPSGDWAHFINYYFRDDGSLAKIAAQLNTFYGDVSVLRNQYFNNAGVVLSSTRKFLDLKTRRPKKPGDYFDHPVPVYRKVSELPFNKLL